MVSSGSIPHLPLERQGESIWILVWVNGVMKKAWLFSELDTWYQPQQQWSDAEDSLINNRPLPGLLEPNVEGKFWASKSDNRENVYVSVCCLNILIASFSSSVVWPAANRSRRGLAATTASSSRRWWCRSTQCAWGPGTTSRRRRMCCSCFLCHVVTPPLFIVKYELAAL